MIELHALHQQRAANGSLRQPTAGMPHFILNVPRRIFQAGLVAAYDQFQCALKGEQQLSTENGYAWSSPQTLKQPKDM
jgi:hypothetical protein